MIMIIRRSVRRKLALCTGAFLLVFIIAMTAAGAGFWRNSAFTATTPAQSVVAYFSSFFGGKK